MLGSTLSCALDEGQGRLAQALRGLCKFQPELCSALCLSLASKLYRRQCRALALTPGLAQFKPELTFALRLWFSARKAGFQTKLLLTTCCSISASVSDQQAKARSVLATAPSLRNERGFHARCKLQRELCSALCFPKLCSACAFLAKTRCKVTNAGLDVPSMS